LNSVLEIKSTKTADRITSDLLIIAGSRYINFAIQNNFSKEITEFGFYQLENGKEWQGILREIELFSGKYNQVRIAFNMNETIMVPSRFFNAENEFLQFNTLFGLNEDNIFISDYIASSEIYCLSAVPISIHAAFSARFYSARFRNINAVIIGKFNSSRDESVLLDFRIDEFSIIVFRKNELLLSRIFTYNVPEDVLYYLLRVCKELHISQQEAGVYLSGLIEKDSAVYRELYKYFIHLDFENLPEEIKIDSDLEKYPPHYYSSICKLASCV